jgi:hypothetical protein
MSGMFSPSLHSTPLDLTDTANHERDINGGPLPAAPHFAQNDDAEAPSPLP